MPAESPHEKLAHQIETATTHPGLELHEHEAKQKAKIPTHREILEIHEKALHETKLDLTRELILRVADEVAKRTGNNPLDLLEIPIFDPTQELVGTTGEPNIYKQQIFDKKTGVPTNQYLLVAVLNNSPDKDKCTVATVLITSDKQGNALVDKKNPGLYYLTTVQNMNDALNGDFNKGKEVVPYEPSELEANMWKGLYTIEDYKEKFKSRRGKSLSNYWTNWDRNKEYSEDTIRSERGKDELLKRISGEYAELAEKAREKRLQILEYEINQRRQLEEEMKNELFLDGDFLMMLTDTAWGDITPYDAVEKLVVAFGEEYREVIKQAIIENSNQTREARTSKTYDELYEKLSLTPEGSPMIDKLLDRLEKTYPVAGRRIAHEIKEDIKDYKKTRVEIRKEVINHDKRKLHKID